MDVRGFNTVANFLLVRGVEENEVNEADPDRTSENILERLLSRPWYVASKDMIHSGQSS